MLYFDTSALIKLMIAEEGSATAAELWASAYPAASSVLAEPEGRAALAAARRSGRLSAAEHTTAVEALGSLQDELVRIGVEAELASHAGELAERHRLRGYDAVHVASALASGTEVTVVSWDADLRRAAAESGCGVAPPLD
ncbi:MAG: type II toxin-antitoxin system VapC family toxin [Solirubrobacteraceae bacterium]